MAKKVKEYRIHDQPVEDISVLEPEATYSYADYLKWSFEERVELIKGKLFKMSPAPGRSHQEISIRIASEVRQFLKGKVCRVYHAPFDVRFPQEIDSTNRETFTVVQPDICVVCDLEKLDDAGCKGAPDLIVEILSPSTSKKDLNDKFYLYEEFGVKEYWVVYPGDKVLEIFYLEKGKYSRFKKYLPGDLVTSKVLFGLNLNVDDIFEGV